jgi:Phage integrase, N-terminal SAM-like domain
MIRLPLARPITKSDIIGRGISTASRRREQALKLLDQTRDVLRLKHYRLRTERSYCDWIERFIRFHQLRHPKELGVAEITKFLTHLARTGNVSAAIGLSVRVQRPATKHAVGELWDLASHFRVAYTAIRPTGKSGNPDRPTPDGREG